MRVEPKSEGPARYKRKGWEMSMIKIEKPEMRKAKMRKTRAVCLALCLLGAMFAMCVLSGCSGNNHQIIGASQDCLTCHADGKETFDVSSPSGAKETSGKVIVKTSADSIAICHVTFTSADGSSYVPKSYNTTNVSNGQAEITLEEGIWAICIDQGDSSKSVLVKSSGDASGDALTVEL